MPNTRIKSDVPRQFSATLGFISLLSLVAISTKIRAPVMRQVVIVLPFVTFIFLSLSQSLSYITVELTK